MPTTRTYTVLLVLDPGGDFGAEVPALPGCFSRGKTVGEALRNVEEAIQCHIGSLEDHELPVPEETGPISIDASDIAEGLLFKVSVALDEATEARAA
jgi:predicted RNase H-like HicB family nuclease